MAMFAELTSRRPAVPDRYLKRDLALLGDLAGIAQDIEQTLPQPHDELDGYQLDWPILRSTLDFVSIGLRVQSCAPLLPSAAPGEVGQHDLCASIYHR